MRKLTPAEQDQLREELDQLVVSWSRRLTGAGAAEQPALPGEPDHAARLRSQLARMTASEHMRAHLADLISLSAQEAVYYGAGYPDLGEAVGISRQAARKRWPNLTAAFTGRRTRTWKQPPDSLGWATGSSMGYPGS